MQRRVSFPSRNSFILGVGTDVSTVKKNLGSKGKSLSEAYIFASTNPQYDDKVLIQLQAQYMKIPISNLGRTCCVQKF